VYLASAEGFEPPT